MNKLEPYRDVEIRITPEGKFEAEVNGKWYTRASLSSLKRFIDENSRDIDAMVVTEHSVRRVTIIGIDGRNKYNDAFRIKEGQSMTVGGSYWEHVFLFEQDLYDWFVNWHKRDAELRAEYQQKLREISDKELRHTDLKS